MSKSIIRTEQSPAAIGPYNQGIVAGGLLYTSGQLPINPVTGLVPSSIEEQTVQVLDNLKAINEAAGSSMEKVLKSEVVQFNTLMVSVKRTERSLSRILWPMKKLYVA